MALVIQQEQLEKNIQISNSYAEKSLKKEVSVPGVFIPAFRNSLELTA
jgi:hypothetical protein